MAEKNLTISTSSGNGDEATANSASEARRVLVEILRAALTRPESIVESNLPELSSHLHFDEHCAQTCEFALATTAALLYSRPELISPMLIDRLAEVLVTPRFPENVARAAIGIFEFMAVTPLAPPAWNRISSILVSPQLDPKLREWMVPLVAEFVRMKPDVVGVTEVIALAKAPELASFRTQLFDEGIEPLVYSNPEDFTPGRVDQIARLFSDAPRYPYILYALAQRRSLGSDTRVALAHQLEGRFPFQTAALKLLKNDPFTLLVVLNVGMGQGDDMVRLAPLLQALLDANPALTITLITWRPYLYDNPRVTTVPINDAEGVGVALTKQFAGVIEFFQPGWMGFTFNLEVHNAVERYLAEREVPFVIKADLGRAYGEVAGNRLAFLYQTVKLAEVEIARARGLDQCTVRNVYEPTMRLLAELGLPQRAAEEACATPSILTGTPSSDAERVWNDLTAPESNQERRPTALVNPLGGSGVTKGFHEQDALVAAELAGLVDEGYVVVILPNGQSWGRRAMFEKMLTLVESSKRANIRIAPDPDEEAEAARVTLDERSTLPYRDRVTRLFKYFAAYADLVVTVEGWLAHLAYILGRPFRLLLAAGSYSPEYHPRFRGPRQRVVASFCTAGLGMHSRSELLREGGPPPMPHRPRKMLLEAGLDGLGRFGDLQDVPALRLAARTHDHDIRTRAVGALGRVAPIEAKSELLAALQDRWPAVAREAAKALLNAGIDCNRELGPRHRELLQAYIDIDRQDWDAVQKLGPLVLPALFKAAECDIHDLKHGAKVLLAKMLTPFVGRQRAGDSVTPAGSVDIATV